MFCWTLISSVYTECCPYYRTVQQSILRQEGQLRTTDAVPQVPGHGVDVGQISA